METTTTQKTTVAPLEGVGYTWFEGYCRFIPLIDEGATVGRISDEHYTEAMRLTKAAALAVAAGQAFPPDIVQWFEDEDEARDARALIAHRLRS